VCAGGGRTPRAFTNPTRQRIVNSQARPLQQQYWLAPHVRACATIDGAVLLDMKRNRYQGVSLADAQALHAVVLDWPAPLEALEGDASGSPPPATVGLAPMLDAQLLVTTPPIHPAPSPDFVPAKTSVGEELEGHASPNKLNAARVLRAYAWAVKQSQNASFWEISHSIREMRVATPRRNDLANDIALADRVMTFRAFRPTTFVAKDRCLVHALALVRYLAHYDLFPSWLIGVRTRPWGAHSWVQKSELVLDSTPEKVTDFTPILIV